MATELPVIKNGAAGATLYTSLVSQANPAIFQAAPTLAAGDVKISLDGGALNNLATLPTVAPAAGKNVKIVLSQAETNADNISIIFADAAGAEWCDQAILIQTAARRFDDLATAVAVAAVQADTDDLQVRVAAVQADTDDLQARLPAALVGGKIDANVGTLPAGTITAASFAAGAIDANAIATDAIGAAELAASAVTEIQAGLATAAAVAAVPTANQNADAFLDRVDGVETGLAPRGFFRLAAAVLFGKASGMATTTAVFRSTTDLTNRVTATVDVDGNRSAVTLNP